MIEKNKASIPFISGGVGLKNGEKFDSSAEYYEITNEGTVVNKFGRPLPFSIEDEMTVSSIHLVIGDALYGFYWSRQYPFEAGIKATKILHGLEPFENELPFDVESSIIFFEQNSV